MVRSSNILLLAPTSSRDSSGTKWLGPPIGIHRIAGYLTSLGHHVRCYDTGLHMIAPSEPPLDRVLSDKKWDIIGFSVLEESLVDDITNMHRAHALQPEATLVAGGVEAQYSYQTIMDTSPCRIVVLGEGEEPMAALAAGTPMHEIPGIVFKNPGKALTAQKFGEVTELMPYEQMPYEKYWDHYCEVYEKDLSEENLQKIHTARVFTRNYCPCACKFCVSTNQLRDAQGGKKARVVDIIDEALVRIVERIIGSHPRVRTIYFTDDNFCINLSQVRDFCRTAIERKWGVSFICFTRLDNLDEGTIELMAQAGFRLVNAGLESFSERVWKEYNKRYNYEKIVKNLELLNRYGIKPFVSVILCSPQGKLEDVELTATKLDGMLSDGLIVAAGVNVAVQPYRGSDFHWQYHDIEVEHLPIPGTSFTVRKEYFIRAQDPEVRELQYRFLERYPEIIAQEVKEAKVKHATSGNQSRIKLKLILKLIAEIKTERSDPAAVADKKEKAAWVTRGAKAIHRLQEYSSGSAL